MNKTIDINRFFNYCKRNLYIARKQFAAIIGILAGLFFLAIALWPIQDGGLGFLFWGLLSFSAILIIVLSPCILEDAKTKNKAVFSYILPVSNLERFLFLIIKYVIIIPIITISVTYLLKEALPFFVNNNIIALLAQKSLDFDPLEPKSVFNLLAVQSVFLLGSFYFNKYTLFKTAGAIISAFIFIYFIGNLFSGVPESNIDFIRFFNSANYTQLWLKETPEIIKICSVIIMIIFPFGMWITTFFKIRETEI